MANKSNKIKENAAGPYYVDNTCSGCSLCTETAPDNFKMSDGSTYAFVFNQPQDIDEKSFCQEALENCPEGSIGNDG